MWSGTHFERFTWATDNTYFYLTAGENLGYSATSSLISFYRTSNCLINAVYKPSEEVLMRLLYTYCVPRLTYGAQVTSFNYRDTNAMSVALNDAIRKIFGWNRWQSVSDLRKLMGYSGLEVIFAQLKRTFVSKLRRSGNSVIVRLGLLESRSARYGLKFHLYLFYPWVVV